MSTEISVSNPFSSAIAGTKGKSVSGAMQARSASEVQAAVFMAKQFPRNQAASTDRILVSCQRESLASKAVYCYQRGGTDITGASIRLAEAIAAEWGNIDCGMVEVDRNDKESTVLAYAWDLETNFRCTKTFTVPHVIDTKRGSKTLTENRDFYEHVANNGARRLRACILAVIPGDVVEAALEQCEKTLVAKADTSPENLKKLVDAFSQIGVTQEMIEKKIQRKIDAMRPAQLVNLRNIFASIKDGMSEPSNWFEVDESTGEKSSRSTTSRLREALTGVEKKETEKSSSSSEPPPSEPEDIGPPTVDYWIERIQKAASDAELDSLLASYTPFLRSGELDANAEALIRSARMNRRQELKAGK